jgi:ABC-type sugar transport system ATPase subunit
VSKSFPGVLALDDVSLQVEAGQIVALVGHNGSGKSTLVKILARVHGMDEGELRGPGGEASRRNRHEGLHFIHQDLGLIPMLSAIENIDLARSHGARSVLPSGVRSERARARALIAQIGAHFSVDLPVAALSPAERTIVAIARALDGWTSQRNVLVLDEPTAALQQEEVLKLFAAIRRLVTSGAGVLMISHRLDEVVDLADRVVVLRDGRVVADQLRGEFDKDSLVRLIAGTEESAEVNAARRNPGGEVVLKVRDLVAPQVRGVDIDVRAREIVGVTGLLGSGMDQIAGAIFGAVPSKGDVWLGANLLPRGTPRASVAAGVGFMPADRRRYGCVVGMNARENLTLPRLSTIRGRAGQIRVRRERVEARRWLSLVDVRPRNATERTLSLFSGGNQQKIIIAKWMRTMPRLLLLEEPTQGVDVAAQASIHELVARIASDGAAVLVTSTDTKELLALCHRVVVLHDGRVASSFEGADLTESAVLSATLDPGPAASRATPTMDGGPRND